METQLSVLEGPAGEELLRTTHTLQDAGELPLRERLLPQVAEGAQGDPLGTKLFHHPLAGGAPMEAEDLHGGPTRGKARGGPGAHEGP